jgi:hypothetical protein
MQSVSRMRLQVQEYSYLDYVLSYPNDYCALFARQCLVEFTTGIERLMNRAF